MDLDALGNIGEFVGSIGVVVSLVYLAIQVRANTASNYAASVDRISTDLQEFSLGIVRDETANRLYASYIVPRTPVSEIPDEDIFNLRAILLAAFMDLWRAYEKYERGQVERDTWMVVLNVFRAVYFDAPIVREWFSSSGVFPEEFRRFVEQEMATRDSWTPLSPATDTTR